MAEADMLSDEALEGLKTRNRKSMTFEEMQAHPRQPGDLFAEFRDSHTGNVTFEYARVEDYWPRALEHHRMVGVPDWFLEYPETQDFLVGFAMISRATSQIHTDFVQLLDHNLLQKFDMGAAQIWCQHNLQFLSLNFQDEQPAQAA